jgi:putative phage-type endonuclease
MSERDDWLRWRRDGIGGSDIPALLGLSRYASPWSLWAEKVGLLEPSETTQRQRIGQVLEDAIAVLFHEATGLYSVGSQTQCRHPEHPVAQCTADGFASEAPIVGPADFPNELTIGTHQIKTDGRFGWPDGVPVNIRAQCVWEMGVTRQQHCWLSVLFAGFRFEVFEIAWDADAERDWLVMLDAAETFWREYVEPGNPPPIDDSDATSDAIRAVWPEHLPGASAPLDSLRDRLAQRSELQAQIKSTKAELSLIDNEIRATLADAEIGTLDGVPVFTYRTSQRAGYVVEPTTVRTLRAATKKDREST